MAPSEDHRAHLGALVAIAASQTTHAFALLTLGGVLAGALIALGRQPLVESFPLSVAGSFGLFGLLLAVSVLLFGLAVPPAPGPPQEPDEDPPLVGYLTGASRRVEMRARLLGIATASLALAGLATVATGVLLV